MILKIWEIDNEISKTKISKIWKISVGVKFKPSASDTQAQNKDTEHSGGVIKIKARIIRTGANLSEEL